MPNLRAPRGRAPHPLSHLLGLALLLAAGCNPPPPKTSRTLVPARAAASDAARPSTAGPSAASVRDPNAAAAEFPPEETLAGEALPVAGTDRVRGRSTVVVDAPVERVRATLLDFESYPEFMPEFSRSRILSSLPGGGKEVYQEMSILGGTIKIWARVKIPQARVESGVETHATEFVEGNVKTYEAIWRLRPIDAARTEATAELFLVPAWPLPTSWVNGKNVEGAAKAVRALKRRAEGKR